jgi:DNA-binding transcriptional MerR regulator
MKIGQLAAASGVSVQTIRYYERRRLLAPPSRLGSGYRDYPDETIGTVLTVKQLQAVGFTLREVKAFLQLLIGQPHDPADTRKLAEAKLRQMGEQIKLLQAMRDELSERLATCTCCNPASANIAKIRKRREAVPDRKVSHA